MEKILDRFLRYVAIDTQSDENSESQPSAAKELDLLNKRFIVFELDVVKDNPILFPVVTIIIMETFINKMRRLQGIRKMILIEEA